MYIDTINIINNQFVFDNNTLNFLNTTFIPSDITIHHLSSVTSTQDLMKNQHDDFYISNHKRYIAITAEQQTNGKGKAQNIFKSPIGGGYITIKTPLDISKHFSKQPWHLLCAVMQSLCMTLTYFDIPIDDFVWKWPNDLLFKQLKCAGILIEYIAKHNHHELIIGLGININTAIDQLPDNTTSLHAITMKPIDTNHFLNQLTKQLTETLHIVYTHPKQINTLYAYKPCIFPRQRLNIITNKKTITNTFINNMDSGKISLGNKEMILPSTIQVIY
ncbi:biotin--[acetyl-CoA-carboxylase] ligase [Chlamydiia bacterium]|nr:biotin--[acetyl-CoA-carboxylase] ligase [Chlamydiia bacterium]